MFTVLFAIGRTPGWLAQWSELVEDKEQKIARPKQIYTGMRTETSSRSISADSLHGPSCALRKWRAEVSTKPSHPV